MHLSCLISPYLQSVPEGECEGAAGLTDWIVPGDAGTEKNHVNQSQILLPVLHLLQQNPGIHKH